MAGITKVDFRIHEACDYKSIIFTETTGAYSVFNSGGWGVPNYSLADVLDVELIITIPSGIKYVLDMATLNPNLPNDTLGEFNIHMGFLGGTAGHTVLQGINEFEYRILVNDGTAGGFLITKRKDRKSVV